MVRNKKIVFRYWLGTRRSFIVTAFKLCFRTCHRESSDKPRGFEIEWCISAYGLGLYC